MRTILLIIFVFSLYSCGNRLQRKLIKEGESNNLQVHFLSDSIEVFSTLEDLQKTIYKNNDKAYRWNNSEREIKLLADLFTKYHLEGKHTENHILDNIINVSLPTRFENPLTYWLLKNIQKDIEEELKRANQAIPSVGIGTLPYWSLNAKAINNDKDDLSLVIVNNGLFNFCQEMVKILLETVRLDHEGENVRLDFSPKILEEKIKNEPQILVRFCMALEDYANNRAIKGQPPKKLQEPLVAEMVHAMEFFTIAHEYGHLVLNHNPTGSSGLNLRISEKKNVSRLKFSDRNWTQEISADLFAYSLFEHYLSTLQKDDLDLTPLLRTMPSLFFTLSEIANNSKVIFKKQERVLEYSKDQKIDFEAQANKLIFQIIESSDNSILKALSTKTEELRNQFSYDIEITSSHPPEMTRSKYIKTMEKIDNQKDLTSQQFQEMGYQLNENLIVLWDELLPQLYKVIEEETEDESPSLNPESNLSEKESKLLDSIVTNYVANKPKDSVNADSLIIKMFDALLKSEVKENEFENQGLEEWRNGNYQVAITLFEKAEKVDSTSFKTLFFLGRSYASIGHDNKAIEYFSKANKIRDWHWSYNNRGNSYRRIGKFQKAFDDLNKAIEMNPNVGLQYINRGLIHINSGDYDKAISDYRRGIRLDNSVTYYYNLLAEALSIDGKLQEIIELEDRFLESIPNVNDKIVFYFFLYTSSVICCHDTEKYEEKLNEIVKSEYRLNWNFEYFGKFINSKNDNSSKEKILHKLRNITEMNKTND